MTIPRRAARAAFQLGLVAAFAQMSRAQAHCTARLNPPDASSAWQAATRQANETIRGLPELDCRELVVSAGPGEVRLTTEDGREAVRPVQTPEDVEPVVRALLVNVPEEHRPKAESGSERLALGAAGGVRSDAANLFSPAFGGSLLGLFGRYELGAFASRETGYGQPSGSPAAGFQLRATTLGVLGGARIPYHRTQWLAGLRLSAAFAREQATTPATVVPGTGMGDSNSEDTIVNGSTVSITPIEARVGPYTGVVFPAGSGVRLRSQLGLELVPFRLRDKRPSGSPLPVLPSWGIGLELGLEVGLL